MDNLYSVNQHVITKPFPHQEIKKVERSNFVQVQQKTELVKLEVLLDANLDSPPYEIQKGAAVYVLGEDIRQPYASKVYSFGEDKFIIVPANRIILVKE